MSDNIHDISVYENVVYLYYDITITEQEQLDINLSKIKDNILKYKTQFDNNAVQFYYDKDYKIYVLLTYHIQKIIAALDDCVDNTTELFTILYKFTKFNYSIVTNETISFYKDKFFNDIKLTNLSILNIKLNYIQNNSNSGDSTDSGNNQDGQQQTTQTVFSSTEVEVEKSGGITPVGDDNTNIYYIVRFVEPKEPPISEYDTDNDKQKDEFVREQMSSFFREKIYGYEEPEPFQTYKDKFDLYNLNIKFSDCYAIYPHSYPETVSVQMRSSDNVELKDSLYYHIYKFIERMNDKTVFEELHQIKGPLNNDKKKKIKNLFKKNGFEPNNKKNKNKITAAFEKIFGINKKSDIYGNFDVTQWNYNFEYNELKFFYHNNDDNNKDINPLKEVFNSMCTNYMIIIRHSYEKCIYEL